MKRSDICICIFMYVFSGFFLYLTQDFPVQARHYPYFVIGLLIFLTTIRLGNMLLSYRKNPVIVNDIPQIFSGFLPKQFWTMVGAFFAFLLMLNYLGFYPAVIIYLLFCLRYFRIQPRYIALVLVVMVVITYITFTWFLNVPLPQGELLEEFL